MLPDFVHQKAREIFCIPGLWKVANNAAGDQSECASLFTRAANSLMEKIHNHGPRSGCMPMFTKD